MKSTMIKTVIAASLMAACVMASAGNDNANPCGNNGNNCNMSGGNGGAGGLGGSGGAGGQGGSANAGAAAMAGAVATGGNASATGGASNATGGSVFGSGNSSNSNKIDNKNTNSNLNAQGQQQGQAQGQQQSSNSVSGVKNSGNSQSKSNAQQAQSTENANNSKQSVNVQGDTVTYEAQKRDPVATAYSAPLVASNGTCFGSASAGLQVAGVGVTGGSTKFDADCDRRYDSQELRALGMREAALALMCQKPQNEEAMRVAGTPCKTAKTSAAVGTSATVATVTPKYEHTDPIVRARLGLPPLK